MIRSAFSALLLLLTAFTSSASAQDTTSFATHVFFKHLIGEWNASGELKGTDGNTVKISEHWKGSVTPEGSFLMEGTRTMNDSTQDYTWTITQSNGLFEVAHLIKGSQEKAARMEASVSEVALTMETSGYLNDNGARLKIVDSFPGDDRDTIDSQVDIMDENGTITLSGKIVHKRVKP